MDTLELAVNIIIVGLCGVCIWGKWEMWRLTGASAMFWIMAGFLWSAFVRIVIVFNIDPLHHHTQPLILPTFICFTIGILLLLKALRAVIRTNGGRIGK
jgi:hypothetical protein